MLQPRLSGCEMGGKRNCVKFGVSFVFFALIFASLVSCQELLDDESIEATRIKREGVPENRAFNTNGIVFDNSPWRPGREMDLVDKPINEEDDRKLKNLATRIMSNGVEVLVKDKSSDGKNDQTKYMEVKTIQPSTPTNMYVSNFPKIDKRIDSHEEDNFDMLQPSELGYVPCTTSCSCSHAKTEGLKTKYTQVDASISAASKYGIKTSKYGNSKIDLRPTNKESLEKKTKYGPYEFETSSHIAPTDRIVEKYTEVINDYSDEKDPSSVEDSELLTNEQAPTPTKINKISNKNPEKNKPEKITKPNKNKFVVADLLKLGSLGIKGLSQLAPVIEKMTGGFIKRQENKTLTTTTIKPVEKLTAYNVDKRVDADIDFKQSSFPIYIPVDEMETSESQTIFTNATLHQNLAWAAEHKQPKAHIVRPKIVHESPLVNGGIPISPGEIITANSDVIVGKPAVGGPLTLAASGIKLHNPVNPPPIDSFIAANEEYVAEEKPPNDQFILTTKVDDSYDLRPPDLPKPKPKPLSRPHSHQHINSPNNMPNRMPPSMSHSTDNIMKTEHIKTGNVILGNHGRPVFLDYIPSLAKPGNNLPPKQHVASLPIKDENNDQEIVDNSPSSSEIVNTHVRTNGEYAITGNIDSAKPFLVDIQPSRVANVLIPHGSSTALVFAGSSEPHKTGDYVDDPLPYPEPGYFGSFSIDAPQMTNVHNVAPTNNKQFAANAHIYPSAVLHTPTIPLPHKDQPFRNDLKSKWKDFKRPVDFNKIPPPTSNQETHVHFGSQITSYDPDIYNPNNGDFEKYNKQRGNKVKDGKEVIDKDYENYLAVPPPPPGILLNQDKIHYDNNKPYNKKPIVHTKPVQDMKVFLNIQHPVPNSNPQQQLPKVTSEIYFAAQAPNSHHTPTYTLHIPHAPPSRDSYLNRPLTTTNQLIKSPDANAGQTLNTYSVASAPTTSNKSIATNNVNNKDNTYTVTLNTATNVASNVGEGQVIGSSVPVDVVPSNSNEALNTNIPIGTNFAITVDDGSSSFENYNMHENQNPALVYEVHSHKLVEETVTGDNRWNKSSADQPATIEFNTKATNDQNIDYYKSNKYKTKPAYKEIRPSSTPSVNSHANFPMMNEHTTIGNEYDNVKQIKEYQEDNKTVEQKRPAKVIPNIPTNSHGWYSSVIMNENNINNIKVDSTTRKVIPLTNDYNSDSLPDFGQKITSVGKPPTDYWTHNRPVSNSNVGKPFTRPSTESSVFKVTPEPTTLYSSPNYLPHNFDTMKQPAYDIPIRDNSDETTTTKVKPTTEKLKPVYETSDEIYDGEEEEENSGEIDGEVSSESMKVPVVSSSNEIDDNKKSSPNTSLLQEEVFNSPSYTQKQKDGMYDFNPGTQTEKPFNNKTNTSFQSNTIRPIYENDSHLKPRPFTINAMTSLDHQLQQPHWQINQLMENATNISYEDNIDLNMGEEMISTKKPSTQEVSYHQTQSEIKYKRPPRPQFIRPINSHTVNDTNIITSTVHIKDKKPLIVEKPNDKSTLPTFTIPATLELNRTSSEIIDLSPPPPTMDYSFRPSTNDEMIMGMSPPPPRTPPAIRVPSRISSTPRPVSPVRTPPPYINKPRRTLPPRLPTQKPLRKPSNRDDVSTYRPAFDMNNIRRPAYNDQPSSQLLPPPRNIPSRVVNPINELPSPTVSASSVPNLVFPTPISTGWLTSSGIDFSSSFNFGPTSIQFPKNPISSRVPDLSEVDTVSDNSYSYETEPSSSERVPDVSSERPITNNRVSTPKDSIINTESSTPLQDSSPEENISDSLPNESSQEETSTEKTRGPQGFKNRPRKPYPLRHDDKKSTPTKYRIPSKPTSIIRPTRTLSRPEILYPTRHTSIRKIVRPIPTKTTTISSSIIESSESSIDDEFIHPTEVMKDTLSSSSRIDKNDFSSVSLQSQSSVATPILSDSILNVRPTHHSGNEVKISDEAIPTKTEFKTTVITLTKTLSEPPKTVSSIGYVNLTHTLTVTHTKTSLVSLSEGAVTQTLVLTNTHTSTLVDIITKVQTQVQPTTIIETVTKHIPIPVEPTPVQEVNPNTNVPLDDISMSSEENENLIIKDKDTKPVQKIETEGEGDNDTFFVVMNKSQNGGPAPPVTGDIETGDYDGVTRNEQVNSNGVSQVLFGEILLAGTPYLETTNVVNPGVTYGKECQPDCKASRNERCQRIDGLMKCVCRPGFARMFPDRPCKPTYTYSVKLALGSQGKERLHFHQNLSDNSSKEYHTLAIATHEGINRMVMQSDLRDVFHGVHITGFSPVQMKDENGDDYQGVMNDFYVQLSDNAHESRLKEVIEKYLRNNNYSLGGTEVHAAGELVDRLDVSDFDECTSGQFHDCSEHAQCFNLRGTYTCSCLEGFADLSVNTLYPGRICSAEPVGCERCNYHGACYSRDDRRVLCECFQWYAGGSCQINLKVVLISLVVAGAVLSVILAICAVVACSKKPRPEPRSIVACIQSMPSLHQGAMPSKQRADRRALISERGESGDTNSMQNASLPYMPAKKHSSNKKGVMSDPPAHDPPPPPAPAVMIPRARLHAHHDSRENIARKRSLELSSEAKLISYLESGTVIPNDEMRRKHSMESSYSANKDRHNKQGALVSAGFKVSTTIRPDENAMKDQRDDLSSVHKADLEAELSRYDTMRKSYSQEDLSEWTDAERRIGELTLSEARSVGGTLPASTGRAASSTRLTHQEANTMAERDLGSTFLLPHVHLYKPDLTSDVSEFDSL
ncbi:uncharacterized protein LOC106137127 isoform X1 [Amyelois transitella]|uniref:uncharacterized protein LOC106137127 isoform X1 n=1 Tax=Amyelois transitella TaxID=680683 RepID=UPI0029907CA5|nr:uncharacterized protein LOC106137127 isoform X1 [Amyelois transitella]